MISIFLFLSFSLYLSKATLGTPELPALCYIFCFFYRLFVHLISPSRNYLRYRNITAKRIIQLPFNKNLHHGCIHPKIHTGYQFCNFQNPIFSTSPSSAVEYSTIQTCITVRSLKSGPPRKPIRWPIKCPVFKSIQGNVRVQNNGISACSSWCLQAQTVNVFAGWTELYAALSLGSFVGLENTWKEKLRKRHL